MKDIDRLGYMSIFDQTLAFVMVHDEDTREIIYDPSEDELEQMCERYGFDLEITLDTIRNREPGNYAMLFVADAYRKHCAEMMKNGGQR